MSDRIAKDYQNQFWSDSTYLLAKEAGGHVEEDPFARSSGTRGGGCLEFQAQLAARRHRFSIGALWRFIARHNITWKKNRPCERARPPGHHEASPGVVRQSTRPRSREARLHRRDLSEHEHGPQVTDAPRGEKGCAPAFHVAAIRAALEDAGVEFIPENGGGPGVRLRKKREASQE